MREAGKVVGGKKKVWKNELGMRAKRVVRKCNCSNSFMGDKPFFSAYQSNGHKNGIWCMKIPKFSVLVLLCDLITLPRNWLVWLFVGETTKKNKDMPSIFSLITEYMSLPIFLPTLYKFIFE